MLETITNLEESNQSQEIIKQRFYDIIDQLDELKDLKFEQFELSRLKKPAGTQDQGYRFD